jgi:hypothetical protein
LRLEVWRTKYGAGDAENTMADQHDSLLREVESEIRREQMQKLWERYYGVIIGAALMIVLAVGGYKLVEARRLAAAETAGQEFLSAVKLADEKKADDAAAAFAKIAENAPGGYATLAKLQIAGAQAKAGKNAEAIAAYDAVAKDASADDLLKSFAQLQAASLRLPDADFTEIENRLTPLTGDRGAFKTSAQELLGIAAFRAKKYDDARQYLEPLLIDPRASPEIQERVKIVLAEIVSAETASAPSQPGSSGNADAAKPDADKSAAPESAKAGDAKAAPEKK